MALLSLVALGGQSFAELCTIDNVPAATLLLPYFEVDLSGSGVDTLFSVNNASAAPTVAHVTLWGDWTLPSIDFDIFLTGYDVETVSLRNVFVNGNLPITAHATNDDGTFPNGAGVVGDDAISPHGSNAAWDSAPDGAGNPLFANCDDNLPIRGGGTGPHLNPALLTRIRNGHTGVEAPGEYGGGCINHEVTDNIARGYITIDNVIDCNLFFPNSDDYWAVDAMTNELTVVSLVNQLWGDWFITNNEEGFAFGDTLVAIEAADPNQYPGQDFGAGDYTFYGRYSQNAAGVGVDQREPLASTWGARYFDAGAAADFEAGTDFIVWRDAKCDSDALGYDCEADGGSPPWFPLDETQVVAFDLQECALEICQSVLIPAEGGVSPPDDDITDNPFCFPWETGRYNVGDLGTAVPPIDPQPVFDFGWMYLNLNFTLDGTGAACGDQDGIFNDIAQSWVVTNLDSSTFNMSVGFAGTQLTSACTGTPNNNATIMGDLDGGTCPWSTPAD